MRETHTLRVMWGELETELRSLSEPPRHFPTLPEFGDHAQVAKRIGTCPGWGLITNIDWNQRRHEKGADPERVSFLRNTGDGL